MPKNLQHPATTLLPVTAAVALIVFSPWPSNSKLRRHSDRAQTELGFAVWPELGRWVSLGSSSRLVWICLYIYIYTCIHAYIHACILLYMHTCIHAYIHAYMHTCIHACIHAYIHYITLRYTTLHYITLHYIHTYITYIHACIHTIHYITLHYITLHYITYIQNIYIHTYNIFTYIHTYLHILDTLRTMTWFLSIPWPAPRYCETRFLSASEVKKSATHSWCGRSILKSHVAETGFHGISIGFLWDFYGISMGFMGFLRVLVGFLWLVVRFLPFF